MSSEVHVFTRRAHAKSRRGCRTCKLRRVKCDEARPSCNNCARRGEKCDFLRLVADPDTATKPLQRVAIPRLSSDHQCHERSVPSRRAKHTPPPVPAGSPRLPSPRPAIGSPLYQPDSRFRLLELRLFHHYVNGARDLGFLVDDPRSFGMPPHLLVETAPRLAVECPFLMDALLGATAAFLRASQPSADARANRELEVATHTYMARSIAAFRGALALAYTNDNRTGKATTSPTTTTTTTPDFDAIYLTSIIIGSHALMQHHVQPADYNRGQNLHQWLQAWRGIKPLVRVSGDRFRQSQLALSIPAGGWQYPDAIELDLSDGSVRDSTFSFLLDDLEPTPQPDEDEYEDDHPYENSGNASIKSTCSSDSSCSSRSHDDPEAYPVATAAGATQGKTTLEAEKLAAYRETVVYLSLLFMCPSRELAWKLLLEAHPVFVACVAAGDSKALLLLAVYLAFVECFNRDKPMGDIARRDLTIATGCLAPADAAKLTRALGVIHGEFYSG